MFLTIFQLCFITSLPIDETALDETTDVEVASVVISAIEQVNIPTLENGLIISVSTEEGVHVTKGDLLAKIDSQDAELARERTQIELESATAHAAKTTEIELARKSLELAESDLQRAMTSRRLYANAVSDEEMDRRRLVTEQAKLQVQQAVEEQQQRKRDAALAAVELQMMDARIKRYHISAPVSGIIVSVEHRAGEWVEIGQPVARIVRVERLRAEGFVDGVYLTQLKRGQAVRLQMQAQNSAQRTVNGVLKFVSPEINAVDGRVRIWAEIDNKDLRLHPGTRATMTVLTSQPIAVETPASEDVHTLSLPNKESK